MPSFHTKTIESILDPVAQQVSRLVILHEEAEDGSAMPDLTKPVLAVKMAVDNLVKVGYETVEGSADTKLKADMPPCLAKVEEAASFLLTAAQMLRADPYSAPARKTLIDGSRGILQGTSLLLLVFDESEVRKIVQVCRSVLEYINIAEVLESMEDLVTFVKSVSPVLTRMTREVDAREKELTHQKHRDWLQRSLEQVKMHTPLLISSIKMFVHMRQQQLQEPLGRSAEGTLASDLRENRNVVVKRLADEILEIIRVLQLTTQDEDELDSVTVMKRAQNALQSKLPAAIDWLLDAEATPESSPAGHKALLGVLDDALRAAEQALPSHRAAIVKAVADLRFMVAALEELKSNGQGDTAQAHALASGIKQRLVDMQSLLAAATADAERVSGSASARQAAAAEARTLDDKTEVARTWLSDVAAGSPAASHNRGQGEAALFAVIGEARKVAGLTSPGRRREELIKETGEVEALACQLRDLWCKGLGANPQAKAIAAAISEKLGDLKESIQQAMARQVVDNFLDTATPLKQLCEVAVAPVGAPHREENLAEKADQFKNHSQKLVQTARLVVAVGGGVASGDSRRAAEEMTAISNQVESMTPRVVSAAKITLHSGGSGSSAAAAAEHLELVKQQWTDDVQKLRSLVDAAMDTTGFIEATENAIAEDAERVEVGVRTADAHQVVGGAASIARRANRVLQVAQQECENSEDPRFVQQVERATDRLKIAIPAAVVGAKALAGDLQALQALRGWRNQNDQLVDAIREVRAAVAPPVPPPPPQLLATATGELPELSQLNLSSQDVSELPAATPLPPPPVSPRSSAPYDGSAPPRPPPPTIDQDAEMERVFRQQPNESQPIMVAARDLHEEMKNWESRDNDLVAAAKRMALLMASLSQLVRGDGGSKKQLIDTAKQIAEASTEVTSLAKMLAAECTDKRMRINLLQVCERIPTIGTQLKILSTVKATMLGAQGSEEDDEATEMLVGNAQNLMQSVRDTVRVAEAASIRMRVDSGYTVAWVRRRPWYK